MGEATPEVPENVLNEAMAVQHDATLEARQQQEWGRRASSEPTAADYQKSEEEIDKLSKENPDLAKRLIEMKSLAQELDNKIGGENAAKANEASRSLRFWAAKVDPEKLDWRTDYTRERINAIIDTYEQIAQLDQQLRGLFGGNEDLMRRKIGQDSRYFRDFLERQKFYR